MQSLPFKNAFFRQFHVVYEISGQMTKSKIILNLYSDRQCDILFNSRVQFSPFATDLFHSAPYADLHQTGKFYHNIYDEKGKIMSHYDYIVK